MTLSLDTLGFSLYPEKTWDGSKILALEVPFTLLNGAPFDVFVEQISDKIHVFDDGLTMHEIVACGVDMRSRFKWEALRRIVGRWDVNLSHGGVFETYAPLENAEGAIGNYLRAMFCVDDWLEKNAQTSRPLISLVEETKNLFKRWHPDAPIFDNPTIEGISGTQLEFDFRIGDTYVDVITPTPAASASYIRKACSLPRPTPDNKIKILSVIDDRQSPDAAHKESCIISAVSDVMPMTKLRSNALRTATAA